MRLLGIVNVHVSLELIFGDEIFSAFFALVRLDFVMYPGNVNFEIGHGARLPPAMFAVMKFLSGVNFFVTFKVRRTSESSTTFFTNVRSRPTVNCIVSFEFALRAEFLSTFTAFVWFDTYVAHFMHSKPMF